MLRFMPALSLEVAEVEAMCAILEPVLEERLSGASGSGLGVSLDDAQSLELPSLE
jgi:hypothetical protein